MRSKRTRTSGIVALCGAILGACAGAQTTPAEPAAGAGGAESAFRSPCQGKVWWADSEASFEDFDFWVGEWIVFERETGVVMGFDSIEKAFGGCALRQHWRQLHDRYSLPGSPWRMEGGSHTALAADGLWHQTWLDNNGSNIAVSGGLDEKGVMTLESAWIEFENRQGQQVRVRYRWYWQPLADGTIHNWGMRATGQGETPEWQKVFDIIYRRNSPGAPVVRGGGDAGAS